MEWPTMPLGEVCQIMPPKAEARQRVSASTLVSFVPMEDLGIDQKILMATQSKPLTNVVGSYTYFADGDVLLAKITPCFENGKLGIAANLANGIGFGSSEYIVFRPNSSVDKEWLYYFLSRESFREEGATRMSGAVGHKRVAKEFIGTYSIPIPPLHVQQRIVNILDEAFAAIAIAKSNVEENIGNASAIFDSYTQSLFTRLGSGWDNKPKTLSELCELIVDCEHKTAPTQVEGIPSIRTPNIGKGVLLLDGVYCVSNDTYNAWTRRAKPRGGDLILAREAPAGNVAVIPDDLQVCLGQRTVLIRPKKEIFDSHFLAALILQPTVQGKLLAHSRGATVQHVNLKDIRALDIGTIPSIAEQKLVVAKVSRIREEIERLTSAYKRKLAALETLKKSLLNRAFSGQLQSKL